jgi:PKD repeat protein
LDPNSGCTSSFSHNISVYSFDNTPGIIEADNKSGCAPLSVNFTQNILDRLSDNYVVSSYEWDFDNDGNTDSTTTEESLQYTYSIPGQYSVD